MELWIHQTIAGFPFWALVVVLVFFICLLSKGADILVDEAVALSVRLSVPPMLLGATVVSLGTTLPEAAVSVMAALEGNPGLALGNAVGSIICDTGLILGIGALMKPLPINRNLVNRQGWIQFGAGVMLVAACYPWSHPNQVLSEGGHFPQAVGFFFVACLVVYFIWSYRLSRRGDDSVCSEDVDKEQEKDASTLFVLLKLVLGIFLVVLSSKVLIPTASEMAVRMSIPEGVIAASLVAFGTSLPELITVVTSVRKGHADLAIGNVVGADILNVFFVVGVSGAVTKGGLVASTEFFTHLFPFMLAVLIIFRAGIFFSKKALGRFFGVLLLLFYLIFLYVNYGA